MDFKKFKADIINAKIHVHTDEITVSVPDSHPKGYETMAAHELEYTKMINLVCDILEEYDKKKQE